MIDVDGLEKRYGDLQAVADVSMSVETGSVFGLVGPNGAGKTSTLKMIAGLLEPTAGEITVDGRDPGDPAMHRRLGYLPEASPLYEEMTPRAYLHFFADLYDVPTATAETRIEEILDRLDLAARDRQVGDFSKGMKRKVGIARSLVNDPDVLIYDEPASGLDPVTTATVVSVTRELAAEGKTIIFSAHDLYHVERVSDRVGIMVDGALAAEGPLARIREEFGTVEYQVSLDVPVAGAQEDGDRFVTTVESMGAVEELRDRAAAEGGSVLDIRTRESSLEDVFLAVAGDDAG